MYEHQKPGLGDEFLAEVDQAFSRVGQVPLQFPEVEPHVRRALLRRFPVAIYFLVDADVVEIMPFCTCDALPKRGDRDRKFHAMTHVDGFHASYSGQPAG